MNLPKLAIFVGDIFVLKRTGLITVLLYSYIVKEFLLYAKAISKDCKFLYVALLLGQFSITGGAADLEYGLASSLWKHHLLLIITVPLWNFLASSINFLH